MKKSKNNEKTTKKDKEIVKLWISLPVLSWINHKSIFSKFSEENPTHIYNSVGTYEVRLDVFNKSPHAKNENSSDIKFVTGKTIIRVEKRYSKAIRPENSQIINYCP